MDARTARETLHHWIDQADDTQVIGFVELLRRVIEQQHSVLRDASAIEKDTLDGFGPHIPAAESYAEPITIPAAARTRTLTTEHKESDEATI